MTDKFKNGTMVFFLGEHKPYWVIEWQEDNGPGAYWLTDSEGNTAVARPEDIDLKPSLWRTV